MMAVGEFAMHKTAFVVLAALSVSACASLPLLEAPSAAPPAINYAKADAEASSEADSGADGAIFVTNYPAEPAEALPAALQRRAFGSPTRRQPDLHLVLATATDRARFYRRRRAKRRRA